LSIGFGYCFLDHCLQLEWDIVFLDLYQYDYALVFIDIYQLRVKPSLLK